MVEAVLYKHPLRLLHRPVTRVIRFVERAHKQAVASVGSFDEVYVGVLGIQLSTNAVSNFRI